jgi:cadmium resistance protein CadD (predicted permease)
VAGVILANGMDNISVYTPLFSRLSIGDIAVTVAVFVALVAVWGYLAWLLGAKVPLVSQPPTAAGPGGLSTV